MNITNLKESLPFCFKAGLVPLIHGVHGIGKSSIIKQWAKENGYKVIDVRLGEMSDAGDLSGLPEFVKDENGQSVATKFITPSIFPRTPKHIIFFDELNRAHKDLLQTIFKLLLDKQSHEYTMPEDCYIVCAQNPSTGDYTTLDFADEAFKDRFVHIKLQPTLSEFISYGKQIKASESLLGFISENPKMLEAEMEDFKLEVKPSRRAWLEGVNKLEQLNTPPQLFQELLFGLVGIEAGTTYLRYKEDELKIRGKDILNNFNEKKRLVEQYSTLEQNRQDILRRICDEIKIELTEIKKLSPEQKDNLKQFLLTIPKDLFVGFMEELFDYDAVTEEYSDESLVNDADIFKHAEVILEKKDK